MRNNDRSNPIRHDIKIEALSDDGRGIARIEGKTTFVDQAVPGDIVTLRIHRLDAPFDEADMIELQHASEDRVHPFCTLYSQCGGCQLQHLSIEAQRRWKQKNFETQLTKALDDKHLSIQPMLSGADRHYRRRARFGLQVSKTDKLARLGFRAKASNALLDIESCPILSKPLNRALHQHRPNLLKQASRAERELTVVAAYNGIAWSTDSSDLSLSPNPSPPQFQVDGLDLQFPADGFIQINDEINQAMVQQALDWLELEPDHRVLDLFCGVGNFSLPIAKRVAKVCGIEGLMPLVESAQSNATINHIKNAEFFKANLFEDITQTHWFRKQRYHRILLDPGRPGAFAVSKVLHQLKPEIIVYVSCNVATLVRDIKALQKHGYRMHNAALIDLFPHTHHSEAMVQLKRVSSGRQKRRPQFRF